MTRAATADDQCLDQLIEEATVDAHDESEQAVGFYSVIEENVAFPFRTEVLGMEVSVTGVDISEDDRHLQKGAANAAYRSCRLAVAIDAARWGRMDRRVSALVTKRWLMAVPVEIAGRGNRRTHPSCLKIPSECRPGVAHRLRITTCAAFDRIAEAHAS